MPCARPWAEAEVGDDGRERDPTVRRLERMAADMMGKEDGLFVVSGTVSNALSIMASVRERGTVLAHEKAHIFKSEMGGLSTLAGLFYIPIPGERGRHGHRCPAGSDPAEAVGGASADRSHRGSKPPTTSPAGGPFPWSISRRCARWPMEFGIPVHMDGARIFNAAVTLGGTGARDRPVRRYGQLLPVEGF